MDLEGEDGAIPLFANFAEHGEFFGYEVTQGVAQMGSVFIRLIQFVGGCAAGIDCPGHIFEIANQFRTLRIDEQARVAVKIAQAALDAIDTVADQGVDAGDEKFGFKDATVIGERLFDKGPIGLSA